LWDATNGKPIRTLSGHSGPVGALAFNPVGDKLASWGEDRTIRIWDPQSGQPLGSLRHESMAYRDSVYSLVISPDNKRLGAPENDVQLRAGAEVIHSGRPGVRFWDLQTLAELPPLFVPLHDVRVVAFSPDGRRLAAGGKEPKVVIVDSTTGELISEVSGFEGRIQSLGFSPDGRYLLTAGADPILRLWEAGSGELVRTFVGHSSEVLTAVFHPDGTRIASGGQDRSILIWDTATGEELVRLPGHTWYVFSLAFTADGETLVSGSGDSTVRLWDAFPVARRLQTRTAAGRSLPGLQPSNRP
jgi:hypothetical protein